MCDGLRHLRRWQIAEDVVCLGPGAHQKEQPFALRVLDNWDPTENCATTLYLPTTSILVFPKLTWMPADLKSDSVTWKKISATRERSQMTFVQTREEHLTLTEGGMNL